MSQLYGENLRMYEFMLRQYLFDQQLDLQIGRQKHLVSFSRSPFSGTT